MKNNRAFKTLLMVALLNGCAANNIKSITDSNTDNSEQLVQSIPFGYVVKVKNYIPEKIKETAMQPEDQSPKNWNELLVTQLFYNMKNVSPSEYSLLIKNKWKDKCPETTTEHFSSGDENGYSYATLILKCQNNNPKIIPNAVILKVIKGKNALYSVQQLFRTDATKERLDKYSENFKLTFLCSKDSPLKCPNVMTNNKQS